MAVLEAELSLEGLRPDRGEPKTWKEELGVDESVVGLVESVPHAKATSAEANRLVSEATDEEWSMLRAWASRQIDPIGPQRERLASIDRANSDRHDYTDKLREVENKGRETVAALADHLVVGTYEVGDGFYEYCVTPDGQERFCRLNWVRDHQAEGGYMRERVFYGCDWLPSCTPGRPATNTDYLVLLQDIIAEQ